MNEPIKMQPELPPSQAQPFTFVTGRLLGRSVWSWMILSCIVFTFGIPLWLSLEDRDSDGTWKLSYLAPEGTVFFAVLWCLWLIPLVLISAGFSAVIELIWKRDGLFKKFFFTGTIVLILGLLLHSLFWPNRLERRFVDDWKIPFPPSGKVIHAQLKPGWLFSHTDVFRISLTASDIDSVIKSKDLPLVSKDGNLESELKHENVALDELVGWQWYYLPPPEREVSGYYYRTGQAYLLLVNPSRSEAIFYNKYHD